MKKITAIALLFLISTHFSFGQKFIGVKGGGNMANINLNREYEDVFDAESKNRVGYQIGLIAQRGLGEKVFLRTEVYYAIKGYKPYQRADDTEATKAFGYINLPAFMGYTINSDFSVFLGPQLGS